MKKYTVVSRPAQIGIGTTLKLTKAQASTRSGSLKKLSRPQGCHQVTSLITFKVGETFSMKDEPGKHLSDCLVVAAPEKPKKASPRKPNKTKKRTNNA